MEFWVKRQTVEDSVSSILRILTNKIKQNLKTKGSKTFKIRLNFLNLSNRSNQKYAYKPKKFIYQDSKPNTTLNLYDIMDQHQIIFFHDFCSSETENNSKLVKTWTLDPTPPPFVIESNKKDYTKYQIQINDYIFKQVEHSHFPTCIDSQPQWSYHQIYQLSSASTKVNAKQNAMKFSDSTSLAQPILKICIKTKY